MYQIARLSHILRLSSTRSDARTLTDIQTLSLSPSPERTSMGRRTEIRYLKRRFFLNEPSKRKINGKRFVQGNVKRQQQKWTLPTQLQECLGSCTYKRATSTSSCSTLSCGSGDSSLKIWHWRNHSTTEDKKKIWMWTLSVWNALSWPTTSKVPPPQAVIIQ